MSRKINMANVTNKKEDTFTWDTLLDQAIKEKFGRRARIYTLSWYTAEDNCCENE